MVKMTFTFDTQPTDALRRTALRLKKPQSAVVREAIQDVLEWRRGPRTPEEIADQEALFPTSDSIPFGPDAALAAADSCRKVKRPRGREFDIAIAACAMVHSALLWTLNPDDFKDIPNLNLLPPKLRPHQADRSPL
jgi:predicted nucleic acid-binding protein